MRTQHILPRLLLHHLSQFHGRYLHFGHCVLVNIDAFLLVLKGTHLRLLFVFSLLLQVLPEVKIGHRTQDEDGQSPLFVD